MHEKLDKQERELSDSELSEVNGGLHHWHPGFGHFGFGGFPGFYGAGFGGFSGVPLVLNGASGGSCGGVQTALVQAQPQVVELVQVQQPTVETVQTSGQSYQLVSTGC